MCYDGLGLEGELKKQTEIGLNDGLERKSIICAAWECTASVCAIPSHCYHESKTGINKEVLHIIS